MGIATTVAVAWYQLSQAEKQAILAEDERARGVRGALVSIVEEHVLNDQMIDIPRLTRLIEQRRREERVSTPITVTELFEKAEFNILGSRYLPFDRKQAIKSAFDSIYSDLSTRAFAPYPPETPNADLLNETARHIQDGKSNNALETLKRLQEVHAKDVQEARSLTPRVTVSDLLQKIVTNPWPFVATIVLYIAATVVLMRWLRAHRRRKLAAPEASALIALYLEHDLPREDIIDRLVSFGVPVHWARGELARHEISATTETSP